MMDSCKLREREKAESGRDKKSLTQILQVKLSSADKKAQSFSKETMFVWRFAQLLLLQTRFHMYTKYCGSSW